MEAVLTMTEERLLTITEAAARLSVSTRTIRRRIQEGLLKAYPMPGRGAKGVEYRIPEGAIQEYLDQFKDKQD